MYYITARKVFTRVHYYIKIMDVTLSRLNKEMKDSRHVQLWNPRNGSRDK